MARRARLHKADVSLQALIQITALRPHIGIGNLIGKISPGGVVPLNGAIRILNHTMSGQTPTVLYTFHIGNMLTQGEEPLLLRIVHIERIASAEIFSAIAIAVGLADNWNDVLFLHLRYLHLQFKAAIQKLAGGLIAAVLQKLADIAQGLQVGRTELAHLREAQGLAICGDDLHQPVQHLRLRGAQCQQGVHQRNAAVARYPEYRTAGRVDMVPSAHKIIKLFHSINQPFYVFVHCTYNTQRSFSPFGCRSVCRGREGLFQPLAEALVTPSG